MSSKLPTTQVITPMSRDNKDDVKIEEIPLPPPELWAELDNSASAAEPAGSVDAKSVADRPRETLDFLTPPINLVTLHYPFAHSALGTVLNISIRRLTVGEVGALLDSRPADTPDNFDIYALMTGIPAPVLRGLIDIDGEAVAGACYDFLPRLFRTQAAASSASSSSSPAGDP